MPVYEYRCARCRRKTSVFVRSSAGVAAPVCGQCGSAELVRLFSTFALRRSTPATDDLADEAADAEGLDDGDPRTMARWMRRMGEESAEDLDPETDEMVRRMEAGEMPEDLDPAGPGQVDDDL